MKEIVKRILVMLNVHPDKNQQWLLMSTAVSGLLSTYIAATLQKTLFTELPAQWIATQALVSAISGLLVGMLWKGRVRHAAISKFSLLAIAESTAGFGLGIYLLFQWNAWVFAIISLLYSTLISNFVGKAIMAFRSVLWQEKEREIYDNNRQIVGSVICIIGFAFSIIALPPLKLAIALWAIGCVVDDIGWIIVYNKNKQQLSEI